MKIKKLQFVLTLLLSLPLVSCVCNSETKYDDEVPQISETTRPIPGLFEKNVVLITGIDFKSGQPVVLSPLSSQEIQPCTPSTPKDYPNTSKRANPKVVQEAALNRILNANSQPCTTKIDQEKISPEIWSAIQASEKIIEGTIVKDGKDIPARFVTSVSALYPGSNCVTYISGGKQYQECSSLQEDCQTVLPLSAYGYLPEPNRRFVRDTCRQFPVMWRNPDCTHLKPVYRKPSMPYSLSYERYIYNGCKFQGGWGPAF